MFYHTLSNGSQQGTLALQRLTAFMELEGTYGRVSPMLQKRILGEQRRRQQPTDFFKAIA